MQGYAVTGLPTCGIFFLQFLRIKRLQGYRGYRGYRGYDSHQGVFSSSNLRLRGYGVTSLWNFFLQFLRIKRLRGYQGYQGYGGYNGLQSQGYKVTGLQTVLNFFNSRMERLQGY